MFLAADTGLVLKLDHPVSRVPPGGVDALVRAASARRVVDTAAAGDGAAAACAAARLARALLEAAARSGHDLAGLVVEYRGATVPSGAMSRTASARDVR